MFKKISFAAFIAAFALNAAQAADSCIVTVATAKVLERSSGCAEGATKTEEVKKEVAPAAKPAAKRAPAKPMADSDTVKALAEENLRLKAALDAGPIRTTVEPLTAKPATTTASVGTMVPRYPADGVVYEDQEGNTFERHLGGSRECKFSVNGIYKKSVFAPISLDKVASKKYCDLQAAEFYASLTPTTPDVSMTKTAAAQVYSSPKEAQSSEEKKTCELKYNGRVVDTHPDQLPEANCKVWTDSEAAKRGWIPAAKPTT